MNSKKLNYSLLLKPNSRYLGIVMLLITGMQALLPFISKAVIDVGIQTQDVNFINIVLVANLALIVSITLSAAVRDWILQHMSSRINIALISDYLIKLTDFRGTQYTVGMAKFYKLKQD